MDNGFRGLTDNRTQVESPPTFQTTDGYQALTLWPARAAGLNTNPEPCDLNNNWHPLGLYHEPGDDFLPCVGGEPITPPTSTVKPREASARLSTSECL